jgi:Protein of unknown function (DUF2911)
MRTTIPRLTMSMSLSLSLGLVVAPLVAIAKPAAAEVALPRESPAARVFQQVGLTEIEIEYGSPAVKGRRIFGAAVPYDKPWSISGSQPPTIRFSRDVVVAGKAVPAGKYRLTAVPSKGDWTLVLGKASDPAAGHDPKAPDDAIRVKVHAKPAPARERLAFLFADFDDDTATLDLEWEKVRVSIPIATNTTQQVLADIEQLDNAWRSYANAARFMLETKKDFDTGLKYADKSLAFKEDWYTYWIKAALLAAKHDYQGAIVQGERAYELGRQQGEGFALEPDLKKALAEWKKKP